MRHNRLTKKFGRNHSERSALLEGLVTSLLKYQQIKTTVQKAKAAQRLADHVITLGKTDTLASRRQAFSYLQNHELTSKLFREVAPRFKDRKGGYTRVMRLDGHRKGDGAQLALLELTEKEIKVKETTKKKKDKDAKTKSSAAHEYEAGKAHGHEDHPKAGLEQGRGRADEQKKEKPKQSFFKNISKFFRNKGGS